MKFDFFKKSLLICLLLLAACGQDEATPTAVPTASLDQPTNSSAAQTADTAVPTPIPPTPTQEPLAASVNGAPITLAAYEKELARYEQSLTAEEKADNSYRTTVLNALIEQALTAQAAQNAGIVVTPDQVEQELATYITAAGGVENFTAWLQTNLYTEEEFREVLHSNMLSGLIVADITADVPTMSEQVRARYIEVADAALADSLLTQIRSGADFAQLAQANSRNAVTAQAGGDLGFFGRGWLSVPQIEEAAFALDVGQVSDVISTTDASGAAVYYLVQVVERDPQRPLPSDLRFEQQQVMLNDWLQSLRDSADIVIMVNPGA